MKSKSRVLLLSATSGAGHVRAAQALEKAFLARGDCHVEHIEPIPGQEERNADHLLEAGAAIRCHNLPAAAWKIAALLDDTDRLNRMRDAARKLGRSGAAAAIAEDALRLLD